LVLAHLLVKVPRPGDIEGIFISVRIKLPSVTTDQSKIEAIPLSALLKNTSKLTGVVSTLLL